MTNIYWISTSIITGFLLLSAYTYFFSIATIEGVKDLGFPNFFRIQLGVLKVIGAFLLIYKPLPLFLK
ncbi:MAG: hypothetical protein AAF960_03005 [Bacteroidota bacterium]